MTVLERVITTLADVLGIEESEIQLSTTPESEQTWDSVAHLNLILALESEFDIELSSAEIELAVSVEGIIKIIAEKS